jgi:hypothetical protein
MLLPVLPCPLFLNYTDLKDLSPLFPYTFQFLTRISVSITRTYSHTVEMVSEIHKLRTLFIFRIRKYFLSSKREYHGRDMQYAFGK